MKIAVAMLLLAALAGCDTLNWRHMGAEWAEALCQDASNCTNE